MAAHDTSARESDATRSVSAVTPALAKRLLSFCQNNTINDDAALDTKLQAFSQAQLNQALILLLECLCSVGPPLA